MELPPTRWRQATVHWTVALNGSNLSTKEKSRKSKCSFDFFGPSVEIRTRGLLNPIQARYQTSPHPDIQLSSADLDMIAYVNRKIKCYFEKRRKIFLCFGGPSVEIRLHFRLWRKYRFRSVKPSRATVHRTVAFDCSNLSLRKK